MKNWRFKLITVAPVGFFSENAVFLFTGLVSEEVAIFLLMVAIRLDVKVLFAFFYRRGAWGRGG